jgi:hypothetical protein
MNASWAKVLNLIDNRTAALAIVLYHDLFHLIEAHVGEAPGGQAHSLTPAGEVQRCGHHDW